MNKIKEIEQILKQVKNQDVQITEQTDLYEENILDSLDAMVFFMQLDEKLGIKIPEDIDLKEEGYYKISKILSLF